MNIVSCDRTISAPIDIVWSLLSTADGLTEWMAVEAVVDLEPGGTIRWVHEDGSVVAGEVLEVVPLRRLVFTYGWESGGLPVPVGSTTVKIELEAIGESTLVKLRHEGLTPEMAERHSIGWNMFIDRLVERAESTRNGTGS
jgi:uncharacterized protein YndB with AHSA1/START domain